MGRRSSTQNTSGIAGKIIGSLIAVLIFGGLIAGVYVLFKDDIAGLIGAQEPEDYIGEGTGSVTIQIVDGDYGGEIATKLRDADVIKTRTAFLREIQAKPEEPIFQPGTYNLRLQMSAQAALAALLDPANQNVIAFTIPEGLRIGQVLTRMEEAGLDRATLDEAVANYEQFGIPAEATSLEGFLFPATYSFDTSLGETAILQEMVNRTFASLDAAGVGEDQRFEIITLASIIQKEARLDDDFYRVSRVIQNRLDQGMKLELDSTVSYGVDGTTVTTTEAERLNPDNLYSTYYYEGLPPGPISAPGDTAIDAAMNPADGGWLYFVTVNLETGETVFSETYAQHLVGVEQWRQWMADNPGWNGE